MKRITVIPGDGIGPDVVDSALKVIKASGANLEFEIVDAGESVMKREKTPLPDNVLDSIKKNRIALKGPITTPVGSGFRSVNVALRKNLDLYANIRPIKSFKGIDSLYHGIDIIVVRENTEGMYSGIEHFIDKDRSAAESIKIITKKASERIARFAFEHAKKEKRKKITCIHKANIMKFTDGLFLETARSVSNDYPEIEFEDRIVDNMCMQLVMKPQLYDVLLCPNLYGDILSDLCAGLVGGLGVAPGANIGDEYAVFEPVHGSAPKYAGKDRVNPTATILSGVLMLRYLGEKGAAERIMNALIEVFKEGKMVTYDLGGIAKTSQFTSYLISKMK